MKRKFMTRKTKGSKKKKKFTDEDSEKVASKIGTAFGKKKLTKTRINTTFVKGGKSGINTKIENLENINQNDPKNFNVKFEIDNNFVYEPFRLIPYKQTIVNKNMAQKKIKISLPKNFLKSLDFGDINDSFGHKIA